MISDLGLVALHMQKFRKETFLVEVGIVGQEKKISSIFLEEDRGRADRTRGWRRDVF